MAKTSKPKMPVKPPPAPKPKSNTPTQFAKTVKAPMKKGKC